MRPPRRHGARSSIAKQLACFQELPAADPLLVAHHARLSGAKGIASKALVAASRIAADRFDYATALDLATEAIEADDTADARIQRATVQLRLTHFDAAQTDAGRALSSDADARALEVAGSVAYYHKDFERAASLGDALIQQASGAIQRVQGQVIRARALHAMGDVPGADELLTRAMATCRRQRLRPPTSIYAFLKVHTGEIRTRPQCGRDESRTLPRTRSRRSTRRCMDTPLTDMRSQPAVVRVRRSTCSSARLTKPGGVA